MRLSAGIVPLRREDDEWRVLVLRAFRNWDFPKGRVEPGEQPFETAKRETKEEADIDDLEFPWGVESIDTEPYSHGKVARYYMGETSRSDVVLPINPALGHAEHHEGRWVSIADAAQLLPPRLAPVLVWVRRRLGIMP